MEIGVPREIKDQEFRVGLNPSSVKVLCSQGHQVFIEESAGEGSSFSSKDYEKVGAKITDRKFVWEKDLIIKVKEPLAEEYSYFKKNQILFTYLHLAANRTLTEALVTSGITAIAYETVALEDGKLPLLTPMSIIAGRLSIQIGARYLEKQQGGRGILLSGIPGVSSAQVVILGGGVVGSEAARIASGMGARVQIFDINVERLRYLETIFGSRVELLHSNIYEIEKMIPKADLLVGAVLIPGIRAPILVSKDLVSKMNPGSVIIDVAVDQGGCIETLKATSHSSPIYLEHNVVHFGVPNMPGAVPWTATQALNNSTLPYVLKLANYGLEALKKDTSLEKGLNIKDKSIVHPALKEVFSDISSNT